MHVKNIIAHDGKVIIAHKQKCVQALVHLLSPQKVPVNPNTQSHVNMLIPSKHEPPFLHVTPIHSLMSARKCRFLSYCFLGK